MKWSDLFVLLYDEERKFAASYPRWRSFVGPGDLEDQYEEFVLQHQGAVERAVRLFAKTNQWPELTPQEVAALRERLDFAIDLTTLLVQSRVRIPRVDTRQRKIKWLLIFAWEWGGFASRRGNFESLPHGDMPATPALTTDWDGDQMGPV